MHWISEMPKFVSKARGNCCAGMPYPTINPHSSAPGATGMVVPVVGIVTPDAGAGAGPAATPDWAAKSERRRGPSR